MTDHASSSSGTVPIAIIGMASLFADSRDLDAYWNHIVRGDDCISDVPPSRWLIDDYYDPDPRAPDKTYCKRGGFIPDVDFDPVEFGLPPNILEVTDVSQLLSLLVARDTLAHAGYGPDGRPFERERVGVTLGVGGGQKLITPLTTRLQYPLWERALRSCGLSEEESGRAIAKMKAAYVRWDESAFPGLLGNVIAGRIANRFDLGGMNCVVDAACAASFAALKLAMSELAEGRCDMMLTGGVDTDNSIFMYMSFSKTPAFSAQDAPRPFDAAADGMMVGEGVGMLLLKRLADAERDGDQIYAVIRGIGTSSDGRSKSIYAPRPEGQLRALRRAYADAGFSPATLGLVEAHGTGTVAGDQCEVTALTILLNEAEAPRGAVALGSVKSQIGHTKAAAGAAGLIKAALALHHKVLPPTIHVTEPNPRFELERSPLYVNSEARPWLSAGRPRRAGVSAFGFGGTNYHVVLEEHRPEHGRPYRLHPAAQEVLVWAESPAALAARCAELAEALRGASAAETFAQLGHEAAAARPPAEAPRLGCVALDAAEAGELLRLAGEALARQPASAEWAHPRGIFYRRRAVDQGVKTAALFAGQGAQYVGMGRELAMNFPELRRPFEQLDAHFAQSGAQPLSQVVFPPPAFTPEARERQAAALQQTEYAQPAIGALSAGMFRLLAQAGFAPDMVAGHSFGELTALWAAGALGDEDYTRLVRARGQAMRPPAAGDFDAGAMIAVNCGEAEAEAVARQIPGLAIANYNGPEQHVLAGPRAAVAAAAQHFAARGIVATALPVAAAFHTPLVEHAFGPFAAAVQAASLRPARLPVYANTTAQPYPADPAQMSAQLCHHLLRPVRFHQQIEAMYAAGARIFVEFGPRSILAGLVRQTLGERPAVVIAINANRGRDSDRQLREAALQLRVAGVALGPLDPWRAPRPQPRPARRALVVPLNGSNYVSERTRAAYEAALNDGYQIPRLQPTGAGRAEEEREQMQTPTEEPTAPIAPAPASAPLAAEPLSLAAQLGQIHQHQRELLQLQQLYLSHQGDYLRACAQLLGDQQRLLIEHGAQVTPATLEHLAQSMDALHRHQAESQRLHEQYLAGQGEYTQRLLQTLERVATAAQPAALPAPAPAPAPGPAASLAPTPEPIALAAPFEAANGSGGNGNGKHGATALMATDVLVAPPPAPVAPPPAYVAPAPPPAYVAPEPVVPPAYVAPAAPAYVAPAAPAADAGVVAALLDVVTELTGYPRETLELGMDMEGDLGIDSIKRVQILGAMKERFADLPAFKPEAMAELRTLGQVVEHISPLLAGAPPAPAYVAPVAPVAPAPPAYVAPVAPVAPAYVAPVAPAAPAYVAPVVPAAPAYVAPVAPAATPAAPAADAGVVAALLDVVTELTGYPRETLELGMDMEGDLGIDSIKRVQILGAMKERFADLPAFKPEAMAELRTLGQVVEHISPLLAAGAPPAPAAPAAPAGPPPAAIAGAERHVPRLKALPPPDRLECALPAGHCCVITDDGSPTAASLALALQQLGWPAVVLRFPETLVPGRAPLPAQVSRAQLRDLSEEQLEQALRTIAESYGPIGALFHLHPAAGPASALFDQTDGAIVRHVFLLARSLGPSLRQAAERGRSCFVAVTRMDGALGAGQGASFSATAGGLPGLTKTLRHEWPGVHCRVVDLSPAIAAEAAAALIVAEALDPDSSLAEVGHGRDGRVTLVGPATTA